MTATADAKIADMIRSRGLDFGPTIIREANRTDFPIGLALALIDQESDFQNIFGADTGAPFAHQEVTKDKVQQLIRHVETGGVSNGVGLTQLTSLDFIKGAEAMGGAHKVENQCRFAFKLMKDLIDRHGYRVGLGAYNGGEGNPQLGYADEVIKLRSEWQKRMDVALKQPGVRAGDQDEAPTSEAAVNRPLKLATPFMKGPDIKALQEALNTRSRELHFFESSLRTDKEFGNHTQAACLRASFVLGLADPVLNQVRDGTVSQLTQQLIRDPRGRTTEDKKRATARRPILERRFEARKKGGTAAVKWARSKVGVHEDPKGSNWGGQVKDWITFTGYDFPVFWCGCFVAFAVIEKGGANVSQRIRLGFHLHITDDARNGVNGFERDVDPVNAQPGDIATFHFEHIALVAKPSSDGMIHTIDGNTSATNGSNNNGGEVAAHSRPFSDVLCVGRLRY